MMRTRMPLKGCLGVRWTYVLAVLALVLLLLGPPWQMAPDGPCTAEDALGFDPLISSDCPEPPGGSPQMIPEGSFIRNEGQVSPSDIAFYTRTHPIIGFGTSEVFLLLEVANGDYQNDPKGPCVRITFPDGRVVVPKGEDPSPSPITFIRREGGVLRYIHTSTYTSVVYPDLFPSIDLRYVIYDGSVKYEFVVRPGGDPDMIRMSYDGIDSLRVNPDGALAFEALGTVVRDEGLCIYQDIQGVRDPVAGSFLVEDAFTTWIVLEGPYDPTIILVIDPVLTFGTYVGGEAYDEVMDMVIDGEGNVYLTGITWSTVFFISSGAYQSTLAGYWDIFVMKINASGDRVLFSTYIGTTTWEEGVAIEIDGDGNVLLTGSTRDWDFPTTTGAYDTRWNGRRDVFVLKLAPDGSSLLYSTFVGGSWFDYGGDITLDRTGRAIVTGWTFSDDFPTTTGAIGNTHRGNGDAILFVLSADGGSLAYSTYISGTKEDAGYKVLVNADGDVLVAGSTASPGFPITSNALQGELGGSEDGFLAMFDLSTPTTLLYSTFLGGSDSEQVTGLTLDNDNDIILGGTTGSVDFPTTSSGYSQSLSGGTDAFVMRVDGSDLSLSDSMLIGGCDNEMLHDIEVDGTGCIVIGGSTGSGNYPTLNWTYQPSHEEGIDAFLSKFTPDCEHLLYSTYLGGNGDDVAAEIGIDEDGNAVMGGYTNSSDLPTTRGSFLTSYGGDGDGFVIKLDVLRPVLTDDDTPATTIDGGSLNFSVKVIDNMAIETAWVESMVTPGDIVRIDLMPGTGDRFHSGGFEFPLGSESITYRFHALDSSGNWNVTAWRSVSIIDVQGPDLLDDRTPNNGTTGDPFTFLALITDNIGLSSVNVEYWFSGSGSRYNISMIGLFEFRVIIELPADSIASMSYIISASDLNGNWAVAPVRTVTVRDDDPPEFRGDLSSDGGTTGDPINLRTLVDDNIAVDEVWVTYWFPSTPETKVLMRDEGEYEVSVDVPPDGNPRMYYSFVARDTAGNTNTAPVHSILILDDDPPVLLDDLSDNSARTGDTMHLVADIVDNDALGSVEVEIWYGDLVDSSTHSMAKADLHRYEEAVPSNGEGELRYRFIASDAAGNLLETDIVSLTIIDDDPPWLLSDGSDSVATTGDPFTFRTQVTDNRGISSVVVVYRTGNTEPLQRIIEGDELTITVPTDARGRLRYHFEISDEGGNLNTTPVVTIDIDDNDPPDAVAAHGHSVALGARFIMDGTGSSDNVDVILWTWTIEGEGEKHILTGPEVSIILTRDGRYEVNLSVEDGAGNHDSVTSWVNVSEEQKPFYSGQPFLWALVFVLVILVVSVAWNYSNRGAKES